MKATAKLKYLRMAPRKVRLVSDLVRGKKVPEAKRLLSFAAKNSAVPILKTLNSAVASARNNFQADENNLYISHIAVNEGPKLKRWRPRARGQAYQIQKKTSHVVIEVNEIEQQKKPAQKASVKPAAPKALGSEENRPRQSFRPAESQAPKPKEPGRLQRLFRRKAV